MNWLLIIVFLILGMLMANMLNNVCGCKNVVEGGNDGKPDIIVEKPIVAPFVRTDVTPDSVLLYGRRESFTNLLDKCSLITSANIQYSAGGPGEIILDGCNDKYKACDKLKNMYDAGVLNLKNQGKTASFCETNVLPASQQHHAKNQNIFDYFGQSSSLRIPNQNILDIANIRYEKINSIAGPYKKDKMQTLKIYMDSAENMKHGTYIQGNTEYPEFWNAVGGPVPASGNILDICAKTCSE